MPSLAFTRWAPRWATAIWVPRSRLLSTRGNCGDQYVAGGPCLYSIDTTTNFGTTVPGANGYTSQLNPNLGTSFAAPQVVAIAGLMHSINANLTPSQYILRLTQGAAPFPTTSADATGAQPPMCVNPAIAGAAQSTECICTTSVCGAGMANALGAVQAALRPIAIVSRPTSVTPGATITLSAGASTAACGQTISSYTWSVGEGAVLSSMSGAQTTLVVPQSGSVDVHLVVADGGGRTDDADIVVSPNSVYSAAPGSAGTGALPTAVESGLEAIASRSSSGGGGTLGSLELGALIALAGLRRRRR